MESEAAEEVARWRRVAGWVLGPGAAVAVWLAPLGVDGPAHRLAGVLAAVAVLWVTEALPLTVTGLLGVAVSVALGVAPAGEAFVPFADPLIFVFVGTFVLARALAHHAVDRRVALAILGLPGIGGRPRRVVLAYAVASGALSMWISNTATVAMMLPVGLSLLAVLEGAGGDLDHRFGPALLLAAAFGASIGGLGSPVGTPPNLIGIGFLREAAGVSIPFFSWMALGLPVVALTLGWAAGTLAASAGSSAIHHGLAAYVARERQALGPWTVGQRNAAAAFMVTVALWLAPGIVALVLGPSHPGARWLAIRLPEGVAALVGAGLVCALPLDRRLTPTLPWSEAARIEWAIVFLYGSGMALGTLAFKTGLAAAVGEAIAGAAGVSSVPGLVLLATGLATILSETTSNTASANMVVPVVIALARAVGVDPVLPAVGATMGASLGFMLPVSTPCNAIVYGTGRIPLGTMLRRGVLLDVVGVLIVTAVVVLLGPAVLGAG